MIGAEEVHERPGGRNVTSLRSFGDPLPGLLKTVGAVRPGQQRPREGQFGIRTVVVGFGAQLPKGPVPPVCDGTVPNDLREEAV